MSTTYAPVRGLAWTAYVLTFGALFGYATFHTYLADGSVDNGIVIVWSVAGFVGSVLLVEKNRRVVGAARRLRATLADLAVIVVALALLAIVPAWVGLVRSGLLLVLFGAYVWWVQHQPLRGEPSIRGETRASPPDR
jgi:hypothetical protein